MTITTVCHASDEVIYGIGAHLGQGKTDPELLSNWIQNANFNSFRDEIYWGDTETSPGNYNLSGRAKNTLSFINKSISIGLNPIVILGYGNKLYDLGDQPYSSDGFRAFANYSKFIANSLNTDRPLLEIWNEWNIGAGTRPRRKYGSPEDYVRLAAAASESIRNVKPNAQIIVGGLADDLGNWPWLQEAIRHGLLNYADGISIHLYNYLNPLEKGGDSEFTFRLNQLEKILVQGRPKNTPKIFITEVGWPNHEGRGRVAPELASELALRFLLSTKESKLVAGVWFYELQDGGDDPSEKEHHFGILARDRTEKPISCSLKKIVPLLNKLTLKQTNSTNGIKQQLYKAQDGSYVTALWPTTINKSIPVEISIQSDIKAFMYNTSCDDTRTSVIKKHFRHLLTNTPTIIQHGGNISIQKIQYSN